MYGKSINEPCTDCIFYLKVRGTNGKLWACTYPGICTSRDGRYKTAYQAKH